MGYLNESGLARYDGLLKNWVTFKSGTVDGVDPLLNWQKTTTASTVSLYPLPAAPLDPVVAFAFTETGPAEGTKGPDNPSTITGVSSITVTRCETAGVDETQYTIDLGSTFYGGSIDLATGVMTVTYRAFELTPSNLNVRNSTEMSSGLWNVGCLRLLNENTVNVFGYEASGGYNGNNYFCNILDWNGVGSAVSYHFSTSSFYMTIEADSASAATSYITSLVAEKYAAGTPVFAGYPLATPYTVQLTPTQIYSLSQLDPYTPRLNTVYSDQVSVQVGYPKSPQATSTELTNAIISLGGNV